MYVTTPSYTGYVRQFTVAATLSGNSFTFGTPVISVPVSDIAGSAVNLVNSARVTRLSNTSAIIEYIGNFVNYTEDGYAYYRSHNVSSIATVSGTTVSVGAFNSNNAPQANWATYGYSAEENNRAAEILNNVKRIRLTDSKFATIYHTGVNGNHVGTGSLAVTITEVSGTTQTNGTQTVLATNNGDVMGAVSHTNDAFIISYYTTTALNSTTGRRKVVTCTVSGTTPTWGTVTNIDTSDVNILSYKPYILSSLPSSMPTISNNSNYFGVALSATKVILPNYISIEGLPQYRLATFTISGNTCSYVANSDVSVNSEFILFKESESSFFLVNQPKKNFTTSLSSVSPTISRYRLSSNPSYPIIYKDQQYTLISDSISRTSINALGIALPSAASTSLVFYSTSFDPWLGTHTIYTSKGPLPS